MIALLLIIMSFSTSMTVEAHENKTCISETTWEACIEYGEQYEISAELLAAIIETESRGQPDVVGGDCIGLMQINAKWHKDRMKRLEVMDLFDEYNNILIGADYLAELIEEYKEISLALDIYRGGSKAFKNYENGIVSNYAKGILERSQELKGR